MYPRPGWVEHDPVELFESCLEVIEELLEAFEAHPRSIVGIGIANQRETLVMWDRRTGEPVSNAIVWQCRRTAELCDELKGRGYEAAVRQKTGLPIDAYFTGTKIRWLLDEVPDGQRRAERGELACGTVDSWLIWNFTNKLVHATDVTNASRTMLFNIDSLDWDDELLAMLNVPRAILPEVRSSSEVFGHVAGDLSAGQAVPIAGVAGDQHASLFGQCCFEPGSAKNTYGTGCFALVNTGRDRVDSSSGLITTVGWAIGDEVVYALEGSVFSAGATVQWLRDGLGIIETSAESERLASEVADNGGVYLVPAFSGLGAPYWDMYARGAIVGLTRGSTASHVARAALESIAYQTRDILDAMSQDTGAPLSSLRVDGGATDNRLLMQFQADRAWGAGGAVGGQGDDRAWGRIPGGSWSRVLGQPFRHRGPVAGRTRRSFLPWETSGERGCTASGDGRSRGPGVGPLRRRIVHEGHEGGRGDIGGAGEGGFETRPYEHTEQDRRHSQSNGVRSRRHGA